MLLKQFLNESEKKQLLNIALSLKYEKDGNGKDVFLEFLSDTNELNNIIYKINKKFNEHFFGFTYIKEHSIFLRINNNGWVSVHQDWVEDRQHVINFNVLLKKPKEGGDILHGNTKVIMEEGDAYILDASIPHGISSLISNDEYYSLIIWHSKNL